MHDRILTPSLTSFVLQLCEIALNLPFTYPVVTISIREKSESNHAHMKNIVLTHRRNWEFLFEQNCNPRFALAVNFTLIGISYFLRSLNKLVFFVTGDEKYRVFQDKAELVLTISVVDPFRASVVELCVHY